MNSEFPNLPEDRLLDELLREQSKGPDEAFLQEIESAVDAGPPAAAKSPATRHYGRFAIAAGIALAAGGFAWFSSQDQPSPPVVTASPDTTLKDERAKAALELAELNKAVRDQEDKVEERRKILATIARTHPVPNSGKALPAMIGKLMYVRDESLGWVIRPGYGDGGRFPFKYADTKGGKNKTGSGVYVSPGDTFFETGLMQGRFKLLRSEVRKVMNPRTRAESDVTIVRIEDQLPNKKGMIYEFPSPLSDDARQNEFMKWDRTAVFSLDMPGMEGREFTVDENTTFSLPPGGTQEEYRVKEVTPTSVVVERADGGGSVEIKKGAIPTSEALAALAGNSAGNQREADKQHAIKRATDAQDYGDARRDLEADQQQLQAMKLKQAELASRAADAGDASMTGRAEISASDLMRQKQMAEKNLMASKARLMKQPAAATESQSDHPIPETRDQFPEMAANGTLSRGNGLGGGSGEKGSGKGLDIYVSGKESGAGLGKGGESLNEIGMDDYAMQQRPQAAPAPSEEAVNEARRIMALSPKDEVRYEIDGSDAAARAGRSNENLARPGEAPVAATEQTSGDKYGTFIDQTWKTPAKDPLSTFSIEVDTASYANVRRMIQEGREIPRDAVRIEEFINAFKYHYQAPKGDAPFAVGAAIAVCPWAPTHQLVRVSIKGREIEPGKRPASNLVFLVDVSGSMQSPDKLPLLKQSMQTMASQLDERDRVAIVVYAGSEGVALPSTRMDAEGRAKVSATLAKLEAGGSTNGGAGIKRAYQLAMENKIEGGVNRVILATDGDFNVGDTDQKPLVEMVKERAKSGVYLTVAGFGTGNLNDAMMDAITHDGNGNYFYIDSEQEGRKVFLQNLSGTLVTIAKDVKIQVEFNPMKVGGYRLIGYANRVLRNEDFDNDKVDAGDIGAGHTVTAFYELAPPGASGVGGLKYQPLPDVSASLPLSADWLTVKLRHKHPDGDESREIAFPLTGDALALDQTDNDFQFASAAALFGMKLRGMEETRDIAWQKILDLAKPGLANDTTEDRAEFVSLVEKVGNISRSASNAPAPAISDDSKAEDGPNVRVIRHQDGSRSIFTRLPDQRTLLKKTYSANGVLVLVYTYKVDEAGNPLGCKIADAQGRGLFKISYGYQKETGRLVEALMFDSQVKRVSPDTGHEMPVQKLIYHYDAEGNRSTPIAYNLLPGKTIEEVLGKDVPVFDANPFQTTDGNSPDGNPKPVPAPAEVVPNNR